MWANTLLGALNYQQEHLSHDSFVTVIPLDDDCISVQEDWLKKLVSKYLENDDVFSYRVSFHCCFHRPIDY